MSGGTWLGPRPPPGASRSPPRSPTVPVLVPLPRWLSPCCPTLGIAGGFKKVDSGENDERVEKARGVAEAGLVEKLGAAPTRVEVLAAETQVVAGTNFKLTLKVDVAGTGVKYYEAKVWEKLPAYGGAMELSSLHEIPPEQVL